MSGERLREPAVRQQEHSYGKEGRNARVDAFRIIAALLIAAIHTSPLSVYSETADFILTRIIGRVAVPFFFMVTGYFVLPRCLRTGKRTSKAWRNGRTGKEGSSYFRYYERKQLLLYGFAILLYLPVNWYAGHLKGAWTIGDLAKQLIWEGTFYHLWYLPGVILGLMLVYLLGRLWNYGGVLLVSSLLYVIGLGGDSYYGLISQWGPGKAFYEGLFSVSAYTRNGVFFAPVFLWLGYGLALRKKPKGNVYGLLVFFLLMLGEGLILHAKDCQRHDSMYLFLPAVMVFLFSLLLEEPSQKESVSQKLGLSAASWAMWMYLLHPIGIILVRGGAKAVKMMVFVENSLLHYLAVVLVSAVLAAGFSVGTAFIKGRQKGFGRKKRRRARRKRTY